MYKSRFKKWGWRKNIRFDQPLVLLNSDAAAGPHATAKSRALHVSLIPARGDASSSSTTPVAVVEKKQDVARASNDLVVDRDRLETYLRRRERRDRQRLGNLVHAPVTVRLPDRFLASQTVLVNVKEYLVSDICTTASPLLASLFPFPSRPLGFAKTTQMLHPEVKLDA